jgi:hypothetical protein
MEKSRKLSLRRVGVAVTIGLATLGSVQATHNVLTGGRAAAWPGSPATNAAHNGDRQASGRGELSERLTLRAIDGRALATIGQDSSQGSPGSRLADAPRGDLFFIEVMAEAGPRFDIARGGAISRWMDGQGTFTAQAQARHPAPSPAGHGSALAWNGSDLHPDDAGPSRNTTDLAAIDAGSGASLAAGGVFGDGRLLSGRPDSSASASSVSGAASLQLGASHGGQHSPTSSPAVQSPVPEPGTWAMAALGLCIVGVATRPRRHAVASKSRAA